MYAPRLALPLALLVGLAACDQKSSYPINNVTTQANGTEASSNAIDTVDAPDKTAPPVIAKSDSPTEADAKGKVPVALRGHWTGVNDGCTDSGAELALDVTPTQLIFHESVGTISRVSPKADGRYAVDAAFTGEGESWTKKLTMRISDDGKQLTIANDGQAVIRKRCATAR